MVDFIEVFRSMMNAEFAVEQLSNILQKLTKKGVSACMLTGWEAMNGSMRGRFPGAVSFQ